MTADGNAKVDHDKLEVELRALADRIMSSAKKKVVEGRERVVPEKDKYYKLMQLANTCRKPENRKKIAMYAHEFSGIPEEAIPALNLHMSPELDDIFLLCFELLEVGETKEKSEVGAEA